MQIDLLDPHFLVLLSLTPVVAWVWRRHGQARLLLRSSLWFIVVLALTRPILELAPAPPVNYWLRSASDGTRSLLSGTVDSAANDPMREIVHSSKDLDLGTLLLTTERKIPRGSAARLLISLPEQGTQTEGLHFASRMQARGIPLYFQQTAPVLPQLSAWQPSAWIRAGQRTNLHGTTRGLVTGTQLQLFEVAGDELRSRQSDGDESRTETTATAGSTRGVLLGTTTVDAVGNFEFFFTPKRAGFLNVALYVVAPTTTTSPPSATPLASTTLAIQNGPRVLYVGASATPFLNLPGIEFTDYSETTATKPPHIDWSHYDLLWVDHTEAQELLSPWLEAQRAERGSAPMSIAQAVEADGLGLLLSGTTTLASYATTALAPLLPLNLAEIETREDPSTTLVIIIDTSSSMSGEPFQLAKEVARLALRRLLPHDRAGIVEFYGAKRWAAPIQPASHHIDLQRALNRLTAAGGTVILPALAEAYYALHNVQTRSKHILVLTDGGVEQAAFEPLIRRMADDNITLSTVLVGGTAHSDFLLRLAQWGGGRYTRVPDRFQLPEFILKEPSSQRSTQESNGSFPLDYDPSYFDSLQREQRQGEQPLHLPTLSRRWSYPIRKGARVVLKTSGRESSATPVIATWNAGLGHATCIVTDTAGTAQSSSRAWTRVISTTIQKSARTAIPFEVDHDRYRSRVRVRVHTSGATTSALLLRRLHSADTKSGAALDSTIPDEAESEETWQRGNTIAPRQLEFEFTVAADETLKLEGCLQERSATPHIPTPTIQTAMPGGDVGNARIVLRIAVAPEPAGAGPTLRQLCQSTGGDELGNDFSKKVLEGSWQPSMSTGTLATSGTARSRLVNTALDSLPSSAAAADATELSMLLFLIALILYAGDVIWRRTRRGESA